MIEADIERIYEEMLVYYRQLEKEEELHSISVGKRHSTSFVGTPRNYAATARIPRPRRTMSGSIAQFASLYEK